MIITIIIFFTIVYILIGISFLGFFEAFCNMIYPEATKIFIVFIWPILLIGVLTKALFKKGYNICIYIYKIFFNFGDHIGTVIRWHQDK